MAVANKRGMTSTTDAASQDVVVDMADKVLLLEPDKNKFVKFVSTLKKDITHNPKFQWQRDQIVQFIDQIGGAVASNAVTALPVANRDRWAVNDLLLVTSGTSAGEVMRVSVASGTGAGTITVDRNVAGAGTSLASNDYIVKIGSAWGEGSTTRVGDTDSTIIALATVLEEEYNYAQVEKTICTQTNSEIAYSGAGGRYSGDVRKRQQMLKGMEHAKKMNANCYFGKRAISGNRRFTGGMIEFITRTSGTTTLSNDNINADVNTFMRYGSERKKLFTTGRVSGKLSKIAFDKMVVNDGNGHAGAGGLDGPGATIGARVRTYIADRGEFDVIVDDVLGDTPGFEGYGLFVDPEGLSYRFAPGRDTKLHIDAQLPDVDGKVDYYLTEWGLQRGHASYHGMWTAVAA